MIIISFALVLFSAVALGVGIVLHIDALVVASIVGSIAAAGMLITALVRERRDRHSTQPSSAPPEQHISAVPQADIDTVMQASQPLPHAEQPGEMTHVYDTPPSTPPSATASTPVSVPPTPAEPVVSSVSSEPVAPPTSSEPPQSVLPASVVEDATVVLPTVMASPHEDAALSEAASPSEDATPSESENSASQSAGRDEHTVTEYAVPEAASSVGTEIQLEEPEVERTVTLTPEQLDAVTPPREEHTELYTDDADALTHHDGEEDEYTDPPDEPAAELLLSSEEKRIAQMRDEVRVVDGRPRYHLSECEHLAGRASQSLAVYEAEDLEFTPCSLCSAATTILARHL